MGEGGEREGRSMKGGGMGAGMEIAWGRAGRSCLHRYLGGWDLMIRSGIGTVRIVHHS